MTPADIIRMAREAGLMVGLIGCSTESCRHFASLVAAAGREENNRGRGTLMFDPYTGTPRHPEDIASDPHGIMLLDPEQALSTSAICARNKE